MKRWGGSCAELTSSGNSLLQAVQPLVVLRYSRFCFEAPACEPMKRFARAHVLHIRTADHGNAAGGLRKYQCSAVWCPSPYCSEARSFSTPSFMAGYIRAFPVPGGRSSYVQSNPADMVRALCRTPLEKTVLRGKADDLVESVRGKAGAVVESDHGLLRPANDCDRRPYITRQWREQSRRRAGSPCCDRLDH